jgi:hypothetical protein
MLSAVFDQPPSGVYAGMPPTQPLDAVAVGVGEDGRLGFEVAVDVAEDGEHGISPSWQPG